jgi:hypothetical protein
MWQMIWPPHSQHRDVVAGTRVAWWQLVPANQTSPETIPKHGHVHQILSPQFCSQELHNASTCTSPRGDSAIDSNAVTYCIQYKILKESSCIPMITIRENRFQVTRETSSARLIAIHRNLVPRHTKKKRNNKIKTILLHSNYCSSSSNACEESSNT